MSKILKVGIAGAGSIAIHRHGPEIAANKNAVLYGVCDADVSRAKQLAHKYGNEDCQVVGTWQELVTIKDLDVIFVCLPNHLHAEVTLAAMHAGKHVLCEKPMADDLQAAWGMVEGSIATGMKLGIGHNQRLMPPHLKAKQLLTSEYLGKPMSFRTIFGHPGPEDWSQDGDKPNCWFFHGKLGSAGDLLVHKADLIAYLLDDLIVGAMAHVSTQDKVGFESTVDDIANCVLITASGISGTATSSWNETFEDNSTIISCEHGELVMGRDPDHPLEVWVKVPGCPPAVSYPPVGGMTSNEEGGQAENSHIADMFIHAVINDLEPAISGLDGYRALATTMACLESSKTGQKIEIQHHKGGFITLV